MSAVVCKKVGCFEKAIDYVGYCRSHKMDLLPKEVESKEKNENCISHHCNGIVKSKTHQICDECIVKKLKIPGSIISIEDYNRLYGNIESGKAFQEAQEKHDEQLKLIIKGDPGKEYCEPINYNPIGREQEQAAKRDKMDNVRYDLISPYMIESLAKTFAEGAIKYGDQNWRKGLPFSNLLNHAMNHLVKYAMGDKSEPHLDHAFWNIGAMIEFRETGRESELNDLYFHKE